MKKHNAFRLSEQALEAMRYIADHYATTNTNAITFALIEWAEVLRKREAAKAARERRSKKTAGDNPSQG